MPLLGSEQVEQFDLDAAVDLAPLGGVVRRDGRCFAETNGVEP